jgi:C4-dicarboxylate-specific signal transduction histidine kinase
LESIERTGSWDTEFRVVWPDGSVHWVLTKGTVVRDDSGQPVRRVGLNLDITERKQSEEVRSHLAAIVESSDDAIIGKTLDGLVVSWNPGAERIYGYKAEAANRFLNRESPDLAQVGECLTDIVADDKRAGEVIKRLQGLLKKGEFQPSSVDFNEVVSDAIQLARNDALRRRVSIKFEPFQGLPPVLGDRIQLCQVVLNLIMNGLEAVAERPPEDRWVLARAVEVDGYRVELTVEDSGKGVAEGDLSRVFEPFFSTKQGGWGWGSRSAGPLWRRTAGGYGLRDVRGQGRSFAACCRSHNRSRWRLLNEPQRRAEPISL